MALNISSRFLTIVALAFLVIMQGTLHVKRTGEEAYTCRKSFGISSILLWKVVSHKTFASLSATKAAPTFLISTSTLLLVKGNLFSQFKLFVIKSKI
ncbi:hypothetical protein AAZV13_16G158000 [Glycine max]